jgi:hypothetical protein
MMRLREDIIRDCANRRMMVSFHGETVPRGQRRRFPNVMTLEAVKGAEWYTLPEFGDFKGAPIHNCTLPFTRNVVGPMDYTPVAFSASNRETTDAHELALPVIFESGWTCIADRPDAVRASPGKDILKRVPAAWDDIRFLGGYPGEYVCLARSNPYDMTLEICGELGLGWYVWELMIGKSLWKDIHGIVYPDGTVRDPSIVAAVRGFFRKRKGERIPSNLDKEGILTRVLNDTGKWLADPAAPYPKGRTLLEEIANLLEAGELVPMNNPPSIQAQSLEEETAAHAAEVRRLLEKWGAILMPLATHKS